MKKLALVLYTIISFVFSLALATNLFAYFVHYPAILGRPQYARLYEPFHILYWYLTVRVPGNQYQLSFVALLLSFSFLGFLGFRIYTKLNLNVLGIYGKARWLKTRELKALGCFAGKGIILGQSMEARFRLKGRDDNQHYVMTAQGRILFDNSATHVLVVAPTRGGKGVSCVVPTLVSWTGAAVVYDIKRENFEVTSGWRRVFSHVLRFEPSSPESVHFNPLWEIEKGPNEVWQAQVIAEIISNPNGDDQAGDHWRLTAKQLLVGAILYVLRCPEQRDKSLHGVYHLLNDPDRPKGDVLNEMVDFDHTVVSETARNMLNKAPNELSSVLSTASSYLSIYQDPVVAANTAYSDFCIRDLTTNKNPCTLYICVNPEQSDRLKPLVRLLLDLIAKKLTGDLHMNKHPLLFLIDEFPSLGRLNFFETQLAYFAGYKIKCMLIAQSFNQLFAKYGERNSILDNCKQKAILGCGSPQDAKIVADYLGSYSMNRKSVSQSGTLGSIIARSKSTSFMETERKLMTVDEILRLPYEDFILITDGKLPYRGKKLMYYLDKRFRRRVNLPALSSPQDQLKELPKRPLLLEWITDAELRKLTNRTNAAVQTPVPVPIVPKQLETTPPVGLLGVATAPTDPDDPPASSGPFGPPPAGETHGAADEPSALLDPDEDF